MNVLKKRLIKAYKDKVVIVTGHTGFKGSWMCELLLNLGARVVGIALPPDTNPSLFEQINLKDRISNNFIDIRNKEILIKKIIDSNPDYVFNLAAQPLVRLSYEKPLDTYETNFMGTIYVLEALRKLKFIYEKDTRTCSSVFITTDKCYKNREWVSGYRESDSLGGFDPYSSSKAASELAISAYRNSYMNPEIGNKLNETFTCIGVASARAGNVIGGGDWSIDRIIPDSIRALYKKEKINVRNPNSTRPWQHVLDPLIGYLTLGALQKEALEEKNQEDILKMCCAYNFGPVVSSNVSVESLINIVLKYWPGSWERDLDKSKLYESSKLNLNWDKAYHFLKWHPKWGLEESVNYTVNWYKKVLIEKEDPRNCILRDFEKYLK